MHVKAGDSEKVGKKGGDINLSGGHGRSGDANDGGNGGDINISGGMSVGRNKKKDFGGDVNIQGGNLTSTVLGGDVLLKSGSSERQSSGSVTLLTSKSENHNSGDLNIATGEVNN